MFFSLKRFLKTEYAEKISEKDREDLKYLTKIFPFKVNNYVIDELIGTIIVMTLFTGYFFQKKKC